MDYCIAITYKCNWNCDYCIAGTHNMHRDFDEVVVAAHKIPGGSYVSISGGEPGLMRTDQLKQIVDILQSKGCTVQINSNGTIFNHPEIVDMVDGIYYHCSENMDIDDVVNKDYVHKTSYMVVVTKNNLPNLDAFMDKHSDIGLTLIRSVMGAAP